MENLLNNEIIQIKERIVSQIKEDDIIYGSLRKFLTDGSKLIRSKITLLYLKSKNISVSQDVIEILSVGEIVHNASLLHDDFVDSSVMRRGKTAFWHKFSPKIAVLSGDYLVSLAAEKLLKLNDSRILKIFFDAIKLMSSAELKQFELRNAIPNYNEYVEICLNKTARLFGAILESSALISGTDSAEAKTFGENFGLIFQLKNDLEPISALNDKENGIYTAIEVLGVEKTIDLIDNCKRKLEKIIIGLPENEYKCRLKGLIEELCLIKKS